VFFLIEVVRGKPVAKEREGMVHFIGMVLLMILMVYVMFKDIKGLF
jgi:regulator of sigma E protease